MIYGYTQVSSARVHPHLPAASNEITLPPVSLRYLAIVLQELGINARDVFPAGVRCINTFLRHDGAITFSQSLQIIRKAIQLTGNESIGLLVAARKSFTAGGLLSLAMLSAPTCLHALDCGRKFYKMAGTLMDVDIRCGTPNSYEIIVYSRHLDNTVLRFLVDEQLASTAAFVRFCTGSEKSIKSAEFTFDAGEHYETYKGFYKCPVQFRGERNCLTLDLSLLRQPMRTADPYVFAQVAELLTRNTTIRYGDSEFVHRVENAIKNNLGLGAYQSCVAEEIGISERGLRRKLGCHSINYRDLVAKIRHTRACELLSQTGKSVEVIAAELGFADVRAFRQAFLRWTGLSPTKFREKQNRSFPPRPRTSGSGHRRR